MKYNFSEYINHGNAETFQGNEEYTKAYSFERQAIIELINTILHRKSELILQLYSIC